jgi:hypothetical protein
MIINRMEINSSAKYEKEGKGTHFFEYQMPDSFVLPLAKNLFIDKYEAFSVIYMPHKKAVTPELAVVVFVRNVSTKNVWKTYVSQPAFFGSPLDTKKHLSVLERKSFHNT